MPIYNPLSDAGETMWQSLNHVSGTLARQIPDLSDKDLNELGMLAEQIWSRIYAERYRRRIVSDDPASDPFWSAIQQAGITIHPQSIAFQGRDITVWTWAIPSADVEVPARAGADTKLEALRVVVARLVEVFREFKTDERTALAGDLATFQAWKAFKQQAGTWDMFDPPHHPDAPVEEEEDEDEDEGTAG